MPSHWTYDSFEPSDHLRQGDLLRRTGELLSVLSQVHNFFCDERYLLFAILTQTCDLVRRSGRCKAEHIQLAVIRELEPLLPRMLEERCGVGVPLVFKKESRYSAQQSLQKILNQNDQARGLFYLHPDADAGVATPSVIMLRISIALKREHYELLLSARCGRLRTEYSNKLGWLSGNLYSRIATPDWEDQQNNKEASAKLARDYLARVASDEMWVPSAWVEAAKAAGVETMEISAQDFLVHVREHAQPEPLDLVLRSAENILRVIVTERLADAIKVHLSSTDALLDSVVSRVVDLVGGNIPLPEIGSLIDELRKDTVFRSAILNHAGSLIKKNLKAPDLESIQETCDALLKPTRLIDQERQQLQRHLLALLPRDQDGVKSTMASISECQLFDSNAAAVVKEAAIAALHLRGADLVTTFVKRLKNDTSLRALLKKMEDASQAFTYAED
jgi:hypothetical protein